MILKEAVREFYGYQVTSGRSLLTARSYRNTLENLPNQNDDLASITPTMLQNFLAPISSPSSQNGAKSALRSFFKWALESDLIEKDPSRLLKMEQLPQKEAPFMTVKEIAKLRQVIKANPRDQLLFEVFINTGMRLSEVQALNCSIKGKAEISIVGKGNKSRKIYLPQSLITLIKKNVNGASPDTPLFLSQRGTRLSTGQIQGLFRSYLQRAGLPKKFHVHSLRHTFLTAIYNRTKDLRLTQELAGHSSPVTTARYAHVNSASKVEAINGLYGAK